MCALVVRVQYSGAADPLALSSQSAVFQRGDWVWRVYPPVSGGKLRYRNCETSSGCRGVNQHLGEYTNTSPPVSGDVALVDPVVGGSPLLTECL